MPSIWAWPPTPGEAHLNFGMPTALRKSITCNGALLSKTVIIFRPPKSIYDQLPSTKHRGHGGKA